MTSQIVFAFDPGETTGFASWTEGGLGVHGQGPLLSVLGTWIPYLKVNPIGLLIIEGAFVGKGAYASLEVAGATKFIEGAVWCAGIRTEVWQPKASSWRAILGFPGSRIDEKGKRRSKRPDYEEDARCLAKIHADKTFTEETTHEAEAICMAAAGWERLVERSAA